MQTSFVRRTLKTEVVSPACARAHLHIVNLFTATVDGNLRPDRWVTFVHVTALLRCSFCWVHAASLPPCASENLEAVAIGTVQGHSI